MNLSQFGSGVKSVQYGTISAATGVATTTATISAVNTAKAMLVKLGEACGATDFASVLNRITLTNSTTVTMVRGASTSGIDVNFVVVEFN